MDWTRRDRDAIRSSIEAIDAWTIGAAAAAILAGQVTRNVVGRGWLRVTRHETIPQNPAEDGVTWPHALGWAAISGVAVGCARVAARRLVAGGQRRR